MTFKPWFHKISEPAFSNAFIFFDGQLYLGQDHASIITGIVASNQFEWNEAIEFRGSAVYGRIGKQGKDWVCTLYSDSYQDEEEEAQYEEAIAAIKERFPEVTEVTYGANESTISELSEYFDDPRYAALIRIAGQTGKNMI